MCFCIEFRTLMCKFCLVIIQEGHGMQYVTGVYALNLPSPDGTPGDWHVSALDWNRLLAPP